MKKRMIIFTSILLLIVLTGALLVSCGGGAATTSAPNSAGGSASSGQVLLQTRCTVCHSIDRVTSKTGDASQWKTVVDRMINNGAQLTPAEEQTLVNYLAATYK